MANQYAQLFQIVGKLQDQVNLCQKVNEPLAAPLNVDGDINATGTITGGTIESLGDVNATGSLNGASVSTTGIVSCVNQLVINGDQVVGIRQPNIVDLTDNSGGISNDTIALITDITNAGSADLQPVRDAIADLAAKVNAILSVMKAHGLINSI